MELFAKTDRYDVSPCIELDLPLSKVGEIDRNYHSPSQRRDAYLELYATGHPCPSWKQIAEALRRVSLPRQADIVESTYVQGDVLIILLAGAYEPP